MPIVVLIAMIGVWLPPTAAAGPLAWSAPRLIDPTGTMTAPAINGVACPSAALCVAVDAKGNVLTSSDPAAGTSGWKVTPEPGSQEVMNAVSCPSVSLCIAVGRNSEGMISTDPTGGSSAWKPFNAGDGGRPLRGVSCTGTSLCVAFDDSGNLLVSTHPARGAHAWKIGHVTDARASIQAVSCPSLSLCVAADADGVLTSRHPASGASAWKLARVWTIAAPGHMAVSCPSTAFCAALLTDQAHHFTDLVTATDPAAGKSAWKTTDVTADRANFQPAPGLNTLSCPASSFCVAGDVEGNVVTSTDPAGGASSWRATLLAGVGGFGDRMDAISCASTTLCVAVGNNDPNVMVSSDPETATTAGWNLSDVDPRQNGVPLAAVSCPSSSLCVAGDGRGNLVTSADPAAPASGWQVASVTSGASCKSAQTCGDGIDSVSCHSTTLCVAGETIEPDVVSSTQPTVAGSWPQTAVYSFGAPVGSNPDLEEDGAATAVSCPTQSLCVAAYWQDAFYVDSTDTGAQSGVVKSTNPTSASPQWSDGISDRGHNVVTAVACASASVCVAVDDAGNVLNALPGSSWQFKHIDGNNRLTGVSCPSASLCIAIDRKGNVVALRHPNSSKPTWTTSHVDAHNGLQAVSCPTTSLCVAVDGRGNVFTSANPAGGPRAWHVTANVDPGLSAVSCPSASLCAAVDDTGHVVIGTHAGRAG